MSFFLSTLLKVYYTETLQWAYIYILRSLSACPGWTLQYFGPVPWCHTELCTYTLVESLWSCSTIMQTEWWTSHLWKYTGSVHAHLPTVRYWNETYFGSTMFSRVTVVEQYWAEHCRYHRWLLYKQLVWVYRSVRNSMQEFLYWLGCMKDI